MSAISVKNQRVRDEVQYRALGKSALSLLSLSLHKVFNYPTFYILSDVANRSYLYIGNNHSLTTSKPLSLFTLLTLKSVCWHINCIIPLPEFIQFVGRIFYVLDVWREKNYIITAGKKQKHVFCDKCRKRILKSDAHHATKYVDTYHCEDCSLLTRLWVGQNFGIK